MRRQKLIWMGLIIGVPTLFLAVRKGWWVKV